MRKFDDISKMIKRYRSRGRANIDPLVAIDIRRQEEKAYGGSSSSKSLLMTMQERSTPAIKDEEVPGENSSIQHSS